MDLLQTVRKEGSRGGVDFKWDDVKDSQHRQNYLGHSLMAPVGRWQKGRDLNWYAKASDADKTPEEIAAAEKELRREELRKVKEAEEDAMARALGLPVPDRSANTEPLGERKISQKEVDAALKGGTNRSDEGRGRVTGTETEIANVHGPGAEAVTERSTGPAEIHEEIDNDRGRHIDGGVALSDRLHESGAASLRAVNSEAVSGRRLDEEASRASST